ncbi:MAG: PLP-dependent aspartate aminotransferase family protein [Balneola sp.]
MKSKSKNIETIAIHGSLGHSSGSKSVVPPIEVSTNFEHSEAGHQDGDYLYTRHSNPNRLQLEKVLAELERGEACAAFSSGMAAIGSVFQALEEGSHIIVPKDVYHGTRKTLNTFGKRWNLEFTYTDMRNLEEVQKNIRPNTKLIYVETPSNPLMHITDLEKVCTLAKSINAKVCVDNTWPSPLNLNPIEFSADLVMHSTTKYLAGHSDILGGAIISAKQDEMFERIRTIQQGQGAVPSPRDCWLLCRSIRSFPYRMRAHNENAGKIAEFLSNHPKIKETYYPGLESHQGHEIARSQMTGFGGMISFIFDGNEQESLQVVASSKLIARATSLGGIESTWEHRKSSEGEHSHSPENLIRLSVGLEHPDDLIEDLKSALA